MDHFPAPAHFVWLCGRAVSPRGGMAESDVILRQWCGYLGCVCSVLDAFIAAAFGPAANDVDVVAGGNGRGAECIGLRISLVQQQALALAQSAACAADVFADAWYIGDAVRDSVLSVRTDAAKHGRAI